MEKQYDIIVIGSGIGGMSAAVMLAKSTGKKVLVLEQHYQPGGQMHSFRRKGYSWDVGLHYVGDMKKGSFIRKVMDVVTGGRVEWLPLPDNYDRFTFGDKEFLVPSNPEAYYDRLKKEFPKESKAIDRYFSDIHKSAGWMNSLFLRRNIGGIPGLILSIFSRPGQSKALKTTAEILEKIKDPTLRSFLVSQWGNYGLTPDHSAFAMHALIIEHYLHGAYYPKGGSQRIAYHAQKELEAFGGNLMTSQKVLNILVDKGCATGVEVEDIASGKKWKVSANKIVSTVGAELTYGSLLNDTDNITNNKLQQIKSWLSYQGHNGSAFVVFLGLKENPEKLGVKGENIWIHDEYAGVSLADQTRKLLDGKPKHAFISFGTLRDGSGGPHTAQVISNIDTDIFREFVTTQEGKFTYQQIKQSIAENLLSLVEKHLPGLSSIIDVIETGSPGTIEHYTLRPAGRMYGVAGTKKRYIGYGLRAKTPVQGLWLAGSDVGSLGIVGAMMGSFFSVASQIGFPKLYRSLKIQQNEKTAKIIDLPLKNSWQASVVQVKHLTDKIIYIRLSSETLPTFIAGQFVKLQLDEGEEREYSIADTEDNSFSLLVDLGPNGKGSQFWRNAKTGDTANFRGPMGDFRLVNSHPKLKKYFIATGSGAAPFIYMLNELAITTPGSEARVIFGCRTLADAFLPGLITSPFSKLDLKITVCLSREVPPSRKSDRIDFVKGYVTQSLEEIKPEDEIYICGNTTMMKDARLNLEQRGIWNLYCESY
jgi:all-trans-retinol 13,14-reductase